MQAEVRERSFLVAGEPIDKDKFAAVSPGRNRLLARDEVKTDQRDGFFGKHLFYRGMGEESGGDTRPTEAKDEDSRQLTLLPTGIAALLALLISIAVLLLAGEPARLWATLAALLAGATALAAILYDRLVLAPRRRAKAPDLPVFLEFGQTPCERYEEIEARFEIGSDPASDDAGSGAGARTAGIRVESGLCRLSITSHRRPSMEEARLAIYRKRFGNDAPQWCGGFAALIGRSRGAWSLERGATQIGGGLVKLADLHEFIDDDGTGGSGDPHQRIEHVFESRFEIPDDEPFPRITFVADADPSSVGDATKKDAADGRPRPDTVSFRVLRLTVRNGLSDGDDGKEEVRLRSLGASFPIATFPRVQSVSCTRLNVDGFEETVSHNLSRAADRPEFEAVFLGPGLKLRPGACATFFVRFRDPVPISAVQSGTGSDTAVTGFARFALERSRSGVQGIALFDPMGRSSGSNAYVRFRPGNTFANVHFSAGLENLNLYPPLTLSTSIGPGSDRDLEEAGRYTPTASFVSALAERLVVEMGLHVRQVREEQPDAAWIRGAGPTLFWDLTGRVIETVASPDVHIKIRGSKRDGHDICEVEITVLGHLADRQRMSEVLDALADLVSEEIRGHSRDVDQPFDEASRAEEEIDDADGMRTTNAPADRLEVMLQRFEALLGRLEERLS